MRSLIFSLAVVFFSLSLGIPALVQASSIDIFTKTLAVGSTGPQVLTLQKVLNRDPDTRVQQTGPGSPGHETSYFGSGTRSAVIRFQEKYASEILAPIGLTKGNGRVGPLTRTKLNALSAQPSETVISSQVQSQGKEPAAADFLVRDTEKIDIYAGDKMINSIQNRITTAVNAAINTTITTQRTATATMPVISPSDAPQVVLKDLSPRSGTPGTTITLSGIGISSNSRAYFGPSYVVRGLTRDSFGNFTFLIPAIPPGRYALAIQTDGSVSATTDFVITDPKNPVVLIRSVFPSVIAYGDTITITGISFSPLHNVVVTTFGRYVDVPSADGKTLVLQFAPETLKEQSRLTKGTLPVPVTVYVVNEYGFSDTAKEFTMNL